MDSVQEVPNQLLRLQVEISLPDVKYISCYRVKMSVYWEIMA